MRHSPLAGTLGLGKLIVLYDSNRISIEGSTDIAFRENVEERMKTFGFRQLPLKTEQISMPSAQQLRLQRLILSIRPSSPSRLRIGFGCPAKQGQGKRPRRAVRC